MLEEVFAPLEESLKKAMDELTVAGPKEWDSHGAPPRIAWKPAAAAFEPPRRIQGMSGDPGPILTRRWLIAVDIWGRTQNEAEQLADLFLAIAHEHLSAFSYGLPEEDWMPGGVTTTYARCVLTFPIMAPVVRRAQPVRPITQIDVTKKINGNEVP